jgi:tetratricopeptide (TPR) repeat protein
MRRHEMVEQMFTSGETDATAREPSGVEDVRAQQHLERAYAYTDAGELENALAECDRAIEVEPQWAEAHNLRGIALAEMGRWGDAIAAYEDAVRLDAGFEEAVENLAEARRGRQTWRRMVALAVPLAVLIVGMLAFARLEAQRGPDWRHELDAYIAQAALPSETVTIQSVVRASEPQNFGKEMGRAVRNEWTWSVIAPPFPAQIVQCALLERHRQSTAGGKESSTRQVAYVAHHSDGLYRVGWLVYAGPETPFTQETIAQLAEIGCDLRLESDSGGHSPE